MVISILTLQLHVLLPLTIAILSLMVARLLPVWLHSSGLVDILLPTDFWGPFTAALAGQLTLDVAPAHVALVCCQQQQCDCLICRSQVYSPHQICVQLCQALQWMFPATVRQTVLRKVQDEVSAFLSEQPKMTLVQGA